MELSITIASGKVRIAQQARRLRLGGCLPSRSSPIPHRVSTVLQQGSGTRQVGDCHPSFTLPRPGRDNNEKTFLRLSSAELSDKNVPSFSPSVMNWRGGRSRETQWMYRAVDADS